MAEYNAKLHVKTSTGYDDINVATKASIVEFDNSSTGMSSTNVNDAIKELNTEKVNKTDIVNNLVSTNTDKPLSANMGKQLNDQYASVTSATQKGSSDWYVLNMTKKNGIVSNDSSMTIGGTPTLANQSLFTIDNANFRPISSKPIYFIKKDTGDIYIGYIRGTGEVKTAVAFPVGEYVLNEMWVAN